MDAVSHRSMPRVVGCDVRELLSSAENALKKGKLAENYEDVRHIECLATDL